MMLEGLELNIPDKNRMISADCAEPTTIRDFKNEGFEIVGLSKDKILIGIKRLQRWNIVFTERSVDLILEAENYIWSDSLKEAPVDKFNHGFDALRYAEKYYKLKFS
jgi:phage terminase large subunit